MKSRAMVLALAGVLVVSSVAGAAAQSATADDYVATVRQDVVFLAEASRLAARKSASDQVKAFARAEAAEQQRVADNLGFWEAERGLSAFAPALVASNGIETATDEMPDTILTGRSAAIDPGVGTGDWSRPDPGVAMISPGVLVMPQLATLDGEAFDKLYKTTQAVALKELAGFYEAYSLTGKDAALKAAAVRQLPLVRQRLADLEAL